MRRVAVKRYHALSRYRRGPEFARLGRGSPLLGLQTPVLYFGPLIGEIETAFVATRSVSFANNAPSVGYGGPSLEPRAPPKEGPYDKNRKLNEQRQTRRRMLLF